MNQTTAQGKHYPKPAYAWGMVILLTLAYVLSYIDRYVLGLLVEPIKADLGLSDTQIGLLMGPAFGFIYAVAGLPIGWLADHRRRTFIVSAGVALWSIATAATGLAKSFAHVFIARMTVGVGEASLSPTAMSMISDSFSPERRGKPIAFYTGALSIGAGVASLIAAGVLAWAKSIPEIKLPLIGELEAWQFIFIAVGLPGVVLACAFLFLPEPARQETKKPNEKSGFGTMFKYVGERAIAYGGIITMFSIMVIVAYSQGWLASAFKRTWGWEAEEYVLVNAIILLTLGPTTVYFAGWLSDKLYQRGQKDAPYTIMLVGLAILVPSGILATLMPTGALAFVFLGLNTVGIALVSAVGVTAILNITPSKISGQVCALYYMVGSLAGANLGPMTVSTMSDFVVGNENLNVAVSSVPLIYGVPGLIFAIFARKYYRKELQAEAD